MSKEFDNWGKDRAKVGTTVVSLIVTALGAVIKGINDTKKGKEMSDVEYRLNRNQEKIFKDKNTREQIKLDRETLDKFHKWK